MKKLSFITLLSLALPACLAAAPPDQRPYQGSTAFEQVKSLVGTWKGKTDMGMGAMEMTVEYRLVAGGSVVEERIFAGTPMEMVTMYHEKKGKLALTHYCMLHNSPSMILKSSEKKTLRFDFDPACGINPKAEDHMHSLVFTFNDADTITQEWQLFKDGKPGETHPFTLKRQAISR